MKWGTCMWTRLKRKFLQLFTESNIDEQSKDKNEHTNKPSTNIEKQIIQNHRKRSFRFPIIPDEPIERKQLYKNKDYDNSDMLIWQQSNRPTVKSSKRHNRRRDEVITSPRQEQRNRRFTPSRVASPIYGYNNRTDTETIEQVPTFMRNKQTEQHTKKQDKKIPEINVKMDGKLNEQPVVSNRFNNKNETMTKPTNYTINKLSGNSDEKRKTPKDNVTSLQSTEVEKEKEKGSFHPTGLDAKQRADKVSGFHKTKHEANETSVEQVGAKVSKEEHPKHEDTLVNKHQQTQILRNDHKQSPTKEQRKYDVAKEVEHEKHLQDQRHQDMGIDNVENAKDIQTKKLLQNEPSQPSIRSQQLQKDDNEQKEQAVVKHDKEPNKKNDHSARSARKQANVEGVMNEQDIQDKPEEKKDEHNKLKQTNRQANRKHKRRQGQQSKKQATKQHSASTVPFNVMMTPADYRKLAKRESSKKAYKVPYHLLNDPVAKSTEDEQWVIEQIEILERTLKHFNVDAKVVHATQGPTVTRFEVKPAIGVKVSRVRNLSDDIKLNMAAKDIRIEAPIPGKNTIGIEIPNLYPQMVSLQEILQTDDFQQTNKRLPIGLGLTVEGKPLVTTVSKMPHGLIAGATGSGKSVCINTILLSLIYKESYNDLKLLLIDPKMVELAPYNDIPHLVAPVITDVKAATVALKWAVDEMEERYEKFVAESVRDISRYNEKMIKEGRVAEKLPYIVIVIDELADLMMVSPQDVEDAICRIAQKARAAGMHLIIATQRPSVDVITGLIKANIPTRIAFSVSSQVDSRTILDTNGAERLLGKGDMLFVENGSGKGVRLQGAFVSDEEIDRVTTFLRNLAPANYLFEQEQLLKQIELTEEEDELFVDAITFILAQNQASTSMLQRQFRIGYNRAARLIDSLEAKGVISGPQGSKPRQVLMNEDQLNDIING